jgi:FtsP/CotA-like multicopper oxidase with cupredoxin domain
VLGWSLPVRGQDETGHLLALPHNYGGELNQGVRQFDLRLQQGSRQFLPDLDTPTFGINGDFLGPTLRFRRNEFVSLKVTNNLGETSSLHWHGFHLPPEADGGPHQPVANGETWNPAFEVLQYPGTYWYHSHLPHRSGEQVYKGLAGMIIVEDEDSQPALPSEYGVDDVPVILQDRRFHDDGEFDYLTRYEDLVMGNMGDQILVNGTLNARFRPNTRLLRLRLLNAANARTFNLAFNDDREFMQVASDGGRLQAPVPMRSLRLAAGERAEILVSCQPCESFRLISLGRNNDYSVPPGAMNRMLRDLNSEAFDILAFNAESSLEDRLGMPEQLAEIYRLPVEAASNTRRFRLRMGAGMRSGADRGPGNGPRNGTGGGSGGGNYFINGRVMDMDFINERIPLNTTEIWEVYNDSPMLHPFHIHNGQFQVLDRDGAAPPANEMGWKDTVRVDPGETVRLIMRFTDYADENNPYMYHCHILEHEDRGMMGQFVLI